MLLSWIVFELLNSVFGVYIMILFADGVLKERHSYGKWIDYLIYGCTVIVSFIIDYYYLSNMIIISIKTVVLAFALNIVFFRSKIYWTFASAMMFIVLAGLAELLASSIVTLVLKTELASVMSHSLIRLYSILIIDFIVLICVKTIYYIRNERIGDAQTRAWVPLILLSISSMVITIQIIYSSLISERTFISILSIFGLLYSDILIFFLFNQLLKQNEEKRKLSIMEAQLELQTEHNTRLLENQFQIRRLDHDFKQHINGFLHLCENKDYETLTANIQMLADQGQYIKPTIDTKNPMLDALLSQKRSFAEQNDIICMWEIYIPPDLRIPILDLNAILGNALDNAIESCIRCDREKYINLYMTVHGSAFLCEIRNTIDKTPLIKDGKIVTSKKEKERHGIGLKSIEATCKRLNGQMHYDFDESVFELRILIPTH